MGHPLTQHPPSVLPFPSASRPSLLGFGFGHPSSTSAFGSWTASGSNGSNHFAGSGFSGAFPNTPTKKGPRTPRHRASPPRAAHPSLKRSRRSLSSSSSPPSPTSSIEPSPRLANNDLPTGRDKDDLSVGSLALHSGSTGRPASRKAVKRFRRDVSMDTAVPSTPENDIDLGVLLASLPPSAHLPILLHVVSSDPSLRVSILSQIPQPELSLCLGELDRGMERVKSSGIANPCADLSSAWLRAEHDVGAFCRTASTYLTFFTSDPINLQTPPAPHTIYSLLYTLTLHLYRILLFVPNSSDTLFTSTPILDLSTRLLTAWNTWLSGLSEDVNQRGEMYPHSTVSIWADGLNDLANYPPSASGTSPHNWRAEAASTWQSGAIAADTSKANTLSLVISFRSAIQPIRARFVMELGWLVGRSIPGTSTTVLPAHQSTVHKSRATFFAH